MAANLKRFSDRSEQILSTIKSGNRMSLETSGSLKEHLEAMTDKYSSVLTEAPENPSQGDKWFDGKSTWTYNGTAWLPEFVTPNKSYFSFAATATANTATDLTQEIEMADNDLYKVTLDLAVTDCGLSTVFVVKEDGGNGVKLWNGSSWATSGTIDVHTLSGNLNSEPVLTFVPVAKGAGETHNKFKLQITSATSLSCRGTATIDHLLSGAITDGAVYDPTSGGGGSGDGFQPDRVIVIDTTLAQDVPGKAYSTFAAAKTYMEANPSLKFCVELPAGEFNLPITVGGNWLIRGNGTVITAAMTSLVSIMDPSALTVNNWDMENCTVTGAGFTGPEQPGALPVFKMRACTLTNISNSVNYFAVVAADCGITQFNAPHTALIVRSSQIGAVTCGQAMILNSHVTGSIAAGDVPLTLINSTLLSLAQGTISLTTTSTMIGLWGCMSTDPVNITFAGTSGSDQTLDLEQTHLGHVAIISENQQASHFQVNIYQAEVLITQFETSTPNTTQFGIVNSYVSFSRVNTSASRINFTGVNAYIASVSGCFFGTVRVDASTSLSIHGAVAALYAPAACGLSDSIITVTDSFRPEPYMYSTDGGSHMSDNPSGATHVGMVKDPTKVSENYPATSDYIWVPLS